MLRLQLPMQAGNQLPEQWAEDWNGAAVHVAVLPESISIVTVDSQASHVPHPVVPGRGLDLIISFVVTRRLSSSMFWRRPA
jgi:hypothetical protein